MEEKHGLIGTYMRYSKRIVVFGLIIWLVAVLAIIGLLQWLALTGSQLDDFVASVLKSLRSTSSGVTVTAVGAYYIHSGVENLASMQKKIQSFGKLNKPSEISEDEGGEG